MAEAESRIAGVPASAILTLTLGEASDLANISPMLVDARLKWSAAAADVPRAVGDPVLAAALPVVDVGWRESAVDQPIAAVRVGQSVDTAGRFSANSPERGPRASE